ncbi:hypothetical protein QRY33_01220 [Campylobacter jejuni]|nr:hypothetical protein [Campylobacter jejuni]
MALSKTGQYTTSPNKESKPQAIKIPQKEGKSRNINSNQTHANQ